MKTTKLILAGWVILLAAGTANAAPYVVLPNGQRVQGRDIRAKANGDINLVLEAGVRTFPKGTYLKAVADKPADYDKAVAAIQAQKWDIAIQALEGIVAKYRYLGWDVEASKLLGQALLGKGDAEEAVKAYQKLFLLAPEEKQNPDIAWQLREAMLKAKQYSQLTRLLDAVAAGGSRADAARAQTMRGDIQLAENNLEQAALDYLRTAILFADVKDPEIQGEAQYKAAAVLEKMRDPRAKDLYQKVAKGSSRYAAQARGKM